MPSQNERLGQTIAQLRREAGLTQEALAFECDLSTVYISQIERGKKSPTVRVLFLIGKALGVRASGILEKVERWS